jgi:2-C-methyl-D-erythritol 4-phosphate cytidylyltransferase
MQNTSAAIIVAAGASRRMQGLDKLWTPLAGRIVLARTIDIFEASALIESIVLVSSSERLADVCTLCNNEGWRKIVAIVPGGARRQDSVRAGLDAVTPTTQWVMIHDAARPLVTPAIIEAGLKAAQEHQAAIAAVPVKDTIKLVQEGRITATLDRSQLWTIQTPQVFSFPLIHRAHHGLMADVTDDATLIEQLGHPVAIFPGAYTNIKITTQEDLLLAEAFIKGYKT